MKINAKVVAALVLYGCCVAAIAAAAISVAHAGDQDFTLINKTGIEIHKVFISPHSSDEWGEDVLGKDTLEDGQSVDIKFGRREKAAHWDLKIMDEHDNAVTWENLNLLEISKVTLHYKDGKAWVDVE
jgi:hypothetical protein